MVLPRVIPVLLLRGNGLVKTTKFKEPKYVGDPRNAVKIFNDKEVDELVVLDILASIEGRPPQYELIREIVSEAFMPVAYGGGIRTIEDARSVLSLGVEKVVLNTAVIERIAFAHELSDSFGAQSIVICIDAKKGFFGKHEVYGHCGRQRARIEPKVFARTMEEMGVGELIINSIDRDGTMSGYDIDLIKAVTGAVKIPVIACGGASSLDDFRKAVVEGGASGVAAGSMFVFHGRHRAVLISYPGQDALKQTFDEI